MPCLSPSLLSLFPSFSLSVTPSFKFASVCKMQLDITHLLYANVLSGQCVFIFCKPKSSRGTVSESTR